MNTVNALTVTFFNQHAQKMQLAHIIRPGDASGAYDRDTQTFEIANPTDRVIVDFHGFARDLNVFGGEYLGRLDLTAISAIAGKKKTLKMESVPEEARLDGQTAKVLSEAIHRVIDAAEGFQALHATIKQ